MQQDPQLRFQIWVDAHLMDEVWLSLRSRDAMPMVEQIWQRHQDIISKAEADGKRWLIEIYDPAEPEDQALRFGTTPPSSRPFETSATYSVRCFATTPAEAHTTRQRWGTSLRKRSSSAIVMTS